MYLLETAEEYLSLVPLLERGITFAAYSLPGDDAMEFIVDDKVSPIVSSRKFIVTTWNGDTMHISDRSYSLSGALHHDNTMSRKPHRTTTSWSEYEASINTVTGLLKSTEGKVVISRQKTIADPHIDFISIAKCVSRLFGKYKNAFRAVYYTPATGAWCVCSPELLLDIDKKSGELHTVALAGTRKLGTAGQWDTKNLREHSFVVKHICAALETAGITPCTGKPETMTTGDIQHILTRISGNICGLSDKIQVEDIVGALHPTPAICGYPVSWSGNIIKEVERHDRECYGGYIAVDDDRRFLAHVNLRCFAFEPGMCCFWGGGGIMSDSCAETEWNEASLKIDATLSSIKEILK